MEGNLACQACEEPSQRWVLQPLASPQMTPALAIILTAASGATLSQNRPAKLLLNSRPMEMFNVLSAKFWGNVSQAIDR